METFPFPPELNKEYNVLISQCGELEWNRWAIFEEMFRLNKDVSTSLTKLSTKKLQRHTRDSTKEQKKIIREALTEYAPDLQDRCFCHVRS